MPANVLYAKQTEDFSGDVLDGECLRSFFSDAAQMLEDLRGSGKRVGYFFIDPLLDTFEAGNKFYLDVLGLESIPKASFYRSGAGPTHAYADALAMIEAGVFDAVSIFAYEPLQHCKKYRGKAEVSAAMKILDVNLVHCYNDLMQDLMGKLGLDMEGYRALTDALYDNYTASYQELYPERTVRSERGGDLASMGGSLFLLTDCANPNIDYAGGVILASDEVARELGADGCVRALAASHHMVAADWEHPGAIVGPKGDAFPHLRCCFDDIEARTGLHLADALEQNELLLNAYTCYPPIPLGFLLAGGFAEDAEGIGAFLSNHALTLDGGLSIGRSPWNCPALRGSILAIETIRAGRGSYGLVHGNGGIGETQGLVLLGK